MGQVRVRVILTNHREEVMVRLGQLPPEQVHRYETEALIDTGAVQSAVPAAVADRVGLFRLTRTGSVSKVEMATPMVLICKGLFPSISTFETPP